MCVRVQILYARDVDQRSTTFEKSLQMGKEFQRRTKAMILRAAVLRNQIHVKVPPARTHTHTTVVVASSPKHGLHSKVFNSSVIELPPSHFLSLSLFQSPPREGSQGELTPANSQTRMSTNM